MCLIPNYTTIISQTGANVKHFVGFHKCCDGKILAPNDHLTSNYRLKAAKRAPRWLTREECERLEAAAHTEGGNILHAVRLGLYAGLRHGEIVHARWEWVDIENWLLHVRSGYDWMPKNGKDRTLPLAA